MAQFFLRLTIICVHLYLIYASSSAFSNILDDTKNCEEHCTQTYPPHTYPEGSDNDACMRGCRLYTVTNFVTADEPEHTNSIEDNGLTPAKVLCYRSCVEAYNETSSNTSACKVGCDGQETISLKTKEKKKGEEDTGIHMLKPIMQVREVVSKVFGMLRVVQSTLTTYFLRDDDKLIAMEGPVEIMVQVVPPSEAQQELEMVSKLESKDNDAAASGNLVSGSGATSIECISRRVGVPPYLLFISLISFLLFLIYVFFVICSNGKRKAKQLKSSIPIPTHALPIKLVRPEDLTKLSLMDEEDGQAPALPHKVKLPDNTNV